MESCTCQRCGYETTILNNLKKHFQRKRVCRNVLSCDKTIQQLIEETSSVFLFACHCGEKFATKQGLNQHRRLCDYNNLQIKKLEEELTRLKEENALLRDSSTRTQLT